MIKLVKKKIMNRSRKMEGDRDCPEMMMDRSKDG
jgi:hypothetical protein